MRKSIVYHGLYVCIVSNSLVVKSQFSIKIYFINFDVSSIAMEYLSTKGSIFSPFKMNGIVPLSIAGLTNLQRSVFCIFFKDKMCTQQVTHTFQPQNKVAFFCNFVTLMFSRKFTALNIRHDGARANFVHKCNIVAGAAPLGYVGLWTGRKMKKVNWLARADK